MRKHIPNRANSFGREICQQGDFTYYSDLDNVTNKEITILIDMHRNEHTFLYRAIWVYIYIYYCTAI